MSSGNSDSDLTIKKSSLDDTSNNKEKEIDSVVNDERSNSCKDDENLLNEEVESVNNDHEVDSDTQSNQGSKKDDDEEDEETKSPEDNKEDQEALEEINKETEILVADINYGIVLSFFQKFSVYIAHRGLDVFKNFEACVSNRRTLSRKLIEFHMNLLKNLNQSRHVKKEKWEYYLSKYVKRFSKKDSAFIEKNGYINCSVNSKVAIIKNLLESQFDENSRLKQAIIDKYDAENIRAVPTGRDNTGLTYWYFEDKECSIRLFTHDSSDENSWSLFARDVEEVKELIETLSSDPEVQKLRASEKYKTKRELEAKLKEAEAKEKMDLIKAEEELNKPKLEDQLKQEDVKTEVTEDKEIKIEDNNDQSALDEVEPVEPKIEVDEELSKNDSDKEVVSTIKNSDDLLVDKHKENGTEESGPNQLNDQKGTVSENDEPAKSKELADQDFTEPIGLRRTSRRSVVVIKPAETPKKTVTVKSSPKKKAIVKKTPNKKANGRKKRDKSNDTEEEESDVSDNESDSSDEDIPLTSYMKKMITNNSKKPVNKQPPPPKKSSKKSNKVEVEPECYICFKVKARSITILCDSCDKGFHLTCLKPKLTEVPENDWYCAVCEQDMLIRTLETKLAERDINLQKLEEAKLNEKLMKESMMSELAQNNQEHHTDLNEKVCAEQETENKNFFLDIEPVGPRSCRTKKNISYTFDEYDRDINTAVGIRNRKLITVDDYENDLPLSRPQRRTRSCTNWVFSDSDSENLSENGDNNDDDDDEKKSDKDFTVKRKLTRTSDYSVEGSDMDIPIKRKPKSKAKAKRARPNYVDSDESFDFPTKKAYQPRKATNTRKKNVKRKRNRYDDTEDEETGSDNESSDDESDISSDEDEKIERFNREFNVVEERRSTRTRKCITETYKEFGSGNSGNSDSENESRPKKPKRRSKMDSDDTFDENSDDNIRTKRSKLEKRQSSRALKKPQRYEEYTDNSSNESEDNSDVRPSANKSVIKKPWSDESDEEERSEKSEKQSSHHSSSDSDSAESSKSIKQDVNEKTEDPVDEMVANSSSTKEKPEAKKPESVNEIQTTTDTTESKEKEESKDPIDKSNNLDESISEYSDDSNPSSPPPPPASHSAEVQTNKISNNDSVDIKKPESSKDPKKNESEFCESNKSKANSIKKEDSPEKLNDKPVTNISEKTSTTELVKAESVINQEIPIQKQVPIPAQPQLQPQLQPYAQPPLQQAYPQPFYQTPIQQYQQSQMYSYMSPNPQGFVQNPAQAQPNPQQQYYQQMYFQQQQQHQQFLGAPQPTPQMIRPPTMMQPGMVPGQPQPLAYNQVVYPGQPTSYPQLPPGSNLVLGQQPPNLFQPQLMGFNSSPQTN